MGRTLLSCIDHFAVFADADNQLHRLLVISHPRPRPN
jgi:hypothetical protein